MRQVKEQAKVSKRKLQGDDDTENATGNGFAALYRGRFLDWEISGVVAIACTQHGALAAVVREHGDIELWDTEQCILLKKFAGTHSSALSSAVLWQDPNHANSPPRLFTGSLKGVLQERDLVTGAVLASDSAYGGAVWGMALAPTTPTAAGTSSDDDDEPGQENEDSFRGPQVAVAMDDGAVRLYDIEEGHRGLNYKKALPRTQGKVLCCAWHPVSRDIVVAAGSDGSIRCWQVSMATELLHIDAGRSAGVADLCVWSIIMLPDGTIVSGDSTGRVSFWDGQHGTLLTSFKRHRADVMALAASANGNRVFASGVDPQIALFRRLSRKGNTADVANEGAPWAYIDCKRPHTHDVRALAVCSRGGRARPLLFSGGTDAVLYAYSVDKFVKQHAVRLDRIPCCPMVSCCPSHPSSGLPGVLIATAQQLDVDVWYWTVQGKEAASLHEDVPEGSRLPCAAVPQHLLKLKKLGSGHLTAVALSADGQYLAYSDQQGVRVYHLRCKQMRHTQHPLAASVDVTSTALTLSDRADKAQEDATAAIPLLRTKLRKLRFPPTAAAAKLQHVTALTFIGEHGELLAAADAAGRVTIVHTHTGKEHSTWLEAARAAARGLMNPGFVAAVSSETAQCTLATGPRPVSTLVASNDGRYLAVVGSSMVWVYDVAAGKSLGHIPPFPEGTLPISAAALGSGAKPYVIAATEDCCVAAYTLTSLEVTEWSKAVEQHGLPALETIAGGIKGISLDPQGDHALLHGRSQVLHIDLTVNPGTPEPPQKRQRTWTRPQENTGIDLLPDGPVQAVQCYHPVLHCQYVDAESMLVLELPWEEVLRKLPLEPMYRQRYGSA